MSDYLNWLALARAQLTGNNARKLLDRFKTPAEILNQSASSIKSWHLSDVQTQKLTHPDWRAIETTLAWAQARDQHLVTPDCDTYPALLKEIADPPLVLHVLGDVTLLEKPQIAIIGTRKPTPRAKGRASAFAKDLASLGLVITSGLATGIDGAAHAGALQTGKTLAVMGTGIDQIYPRYHQKLAEEIIQSGALISELPLGHPPTREAFPRRNRIISGLSLGTLIVEAALKSGSLITARLAMEQGRDVFAMPGSIDNVQSKGCHHLIKQGAKLVESLKDIADELLSVLQCKPNFAQNEQNLANNQEDSSPLLRLFCDNNPVSTDDLQANSSLSAENLNQALLDLELKGIIKRVPGGYTLL
jgi:DNA processing protein